jgi:hypothetical protein
MGYRLYLNSGKATIAEIYFGKFESLAVTSPRRLRTFRALCRLRLLHKT